MRHLNDPGTIDLMTGRLLLGYARVSTDDQDLTNQRAELHAAGYVFEPPGHARTTSLPAILAGLTVEELATWPGELADQERARRILFK